MVNPTFGDVVKDPACGTADFLVGAKRVAYDRHKTDISAQLYGIDTAPLAVNLSVFNMILNGDGQSHISVGDSLKLIGKDEGNFTVALCNPPFGTRIVEKRKDVLKQFSLGRVSEEAESEPLSAQETGILFVEVCVRAVAAGGRIGIIVPNGYLGNRSERYLSLRRWLLRHCRIAAIVGFPRFTFKRAGADVSASVIICEKRASPLNDLALAPDNPIHFNLLNKVGWDLRSKRGGRVHLRDPVTGEQVIDPETNEPTLDSVTCSPKLYQS